MTPHESIKAERFMKDGFEQWLGWPTTLEMAVDVAYEHGDIVHPIDASYFDNTALRKLLEAAYSAGGLNMWLFTGAGIA